jgi:hypothetical protein
MNIIVNITNLSYEHPISKFQNWAKKIFLVDQKNFRRTNNTFNPPSFISLSAQIILPLKLLFSRTFYDSNILKKKYLPKFSVFIVDFWLNCELARVNKN